MSTVEQIAEQLNKLTLLEAAQLSKLLQETWGDLLNRGHRSLLLEYPPTSLGGVLAGLLQDVHELALWRREHTDELHQNPLDRADQLGAQLLPRREVGERPELRRRQHLALHVPRLDRERLMSLRERVERFGEGDRVLLREDHARGAREMRTELLEPGGLDRQPREAGLDDLVLRR